MYCKLDRIKVLQINNCNNTRSSLLKGCVGLLRNRLDNIHRVIMLGIRAIQAIS